MDENTSLNIESQETPARPELELRPEKHQRFTKINWLGAAIAIFIGIGSLKLLVSGVNVGMGLLGIAIIALFFYARWRSRQPNASNIWATVGTIIASLFIAGGLAVTGIFILLMVALSSWGGGGFGGGSGK